MRHFILVLAVVALIAPAAFAAPDAASLAAGYSTPVLGAAVRVSGLTVTLSNMTFELQSGSAATLVSGGNKSGIFFSGKGRYRLRSVDKTEASLVLFEAKKLDRSAKKQDDGSVLIEESFDRLMLLVSGAPLPELKGADGEALADAYQKHREKYSNAQWSSPAHLLALRDATAATTPVAVAEMSGLEATAWILDTVEAKRETLYAFVTTSSAHSAIRRLMIPIEISDQPIGRTRAEFLQPLVLLVDVDYTLVDRGDGAKLTVTETLVPRRAATSAFRLNLLSGVWDDDLHYREAKLKSVTDESGKKLKFHFDRHSVIVDAGRTLPTGEPFAVRFEIEGDFLVRPSGDSFWQLGTSPWFPQPDFNGQFYTVHSVVKVKKPWIAFAPGATVARKEEGEFNVVENVLDKPMQFTVVHAGKYTMYEEKIGDVTIRVAPYASTNQRAAKQLARFASQIIKFYEPWLGPFPFTEFNIIEINDLGYGQAPPGTMFITKEAFNPLINQENRLYSQGVNQRFAHEIAHQYFGHVVKIGSAEEQWISEAFSEYVSALVEKQITGKNGYDTLVAEWRLGAKEAGAIAPIVLANRVYVPGDWTSTVKHRQGLLYSKGAYLLTSLHKQLGDEKFFLFLRNVQGLYAGRFVTTKNLVEVLKRVDSKDHSSTFDRFVWGTEMPAMK